MSQHEELIRRIFDEIINAGNVDAVDELMTEDYVDHGPMGAMHGVDAFKQMVAMWRDAVPDVHCEVETAFSEGDMVAWNVRVTGTHTGEMMGIPPTGKSVTVSGMTINRISGGRVVEDWTVVDQLGLLQQLGAVPAPGGTPS